MFGLAIHGLRHVRCVPLGRFHNNGPWVAAIRTMWAIIRNCWDAPNQGRRLCTTAVTVEMFVFFGTPLPD